VAVIIGNRLPKPNKASIVHLVSVEGRYTDAGDFDFRNATGPIRLVSLKSWRFACLDKEGSFKGLVRDLGVGELRMPPLNQGSAQFAAAEGFFKTGAVPMRHLMRQGNRTISWYHGPLTPGPGLGAVAASLPARAADALVRYNATYGMFDVSYAAAWELGRLLALQSRSFAIGLARWKREHAAWVKDVQQPVPAYLRGDARPPHLELPKEVAGWFDDVALLQGVPFRYLVPDEQMLPPGSIRFFQVDRDWVACLLDGAFSIGRVLGKDIEYDAKDRQHHLAGRTKIQLSGVLIRSEVVAGWSGLRVDGYDVAMRDVNTPSKPALPKRRMALLSHSVLLCLFEGVVQTVDLHLRPQTLHFGLDAATSAGVTTYSRDLKAPLTGKLTMPATGVLRAAAFPKSTSCSAAEFARQMVTSADRVRFSIKQG
jgi:hypothetical protein